MNSRSRNVGTGSSEHDLVGDVIMMRRTAASVNGWNDDSDEKPVIDEPLLGKLSSLSIPDEIYNWIENFFSVRGHCTRFGNDISEIAEITASIVQGSSLGPAAVVVPAVH